MTANRKSINKLNIVISIVIAFTAWVYVVYNYSPMKEVTYYDVPIKYIGEDSLEYMGLQVGESSNDTIDVTLNIDRKNYKEISATDIFVAADVSSAVQGDNGISLDVTPPGNATVEKTSISTITVTTIPWSPAEEEN